MVTDRGGLPSSLPDSSQASSLILHQPLLGLSVFLFLGQTQGWPHTTTCYPIQTSPHLSQDPLAKLDGHKPSNADLPELDQIP